MPKISPAQEQQRRAQILAAAEQEADVILWDGGNNDLPFYAPDLHLVLADPLRPGDEAAYHPGEANVRMADLVLVAKCDSARPDDIAAVEASVRRVVSTLLHLPTVRVKELASAPAATTYEEALRELFGLDRRAPGAVSSTPLEVQPLPDPRVDGDLLRGGVL